MDTLDCCKCGACCFSSEDCYVLVRSADYDRLGAAAAELTRFQGGLCFMRMSEGHCAALDVRPTGEYLCKVYEQRPDACREFAAGSHACERARDERAARVLVRARTRLSRSRP